MKNILSENMRRFNTKNLTEAAAAVVNGKQFQIDVREEKFVITDSSKKRFTYTMKSPGFISFTIPVLRIETSGSDYRLTYKHPVYKDIRISPVQADKMNGLLAQLGANEIEMEIRDPETQETQDLIFVRG